MGKKYALCISGEFRTCALAWRNNLRFFNDLSNEYYFFVTTWDFNSGPNREINLINLVLNNIFGYQFNYPRPSSISESDVLQVFQGINNVF